MSPGVDNLKLLLKARVQGFATFFEDSQLFRILFSSYYLRPTHGL
jgi:hypothetical protein